MLRRRSSVLLLSVLLLGAILRLVPYATYPTDHRTLSPWRESDYTQIARSFYRESANPIYPRVDWREDTAGFVEMELPVIPWSAALLYRAFGYHEQFLRWIAIAAGVMVLVAFAALARRLLQPRAALFATGLVALNGLMIHLSSSVQPEALQLLFTLLAATAVWRWTTEDRDSWLLIAAALTALAILAKASAAYLGVILAYWVLRKRGVGALARGKVWAAAVVAALPPAAWYAWAYNHYLSTGLSLGLSNETHWLSWDVLRHPRFPVLGNVQAELVDVYGVAGVVLAASALILPWRRIEFVVVWLGSVGLLYVVSADTSGDPWALHYHANSIAPACLLMGLGLEALSTAKRRIRLARRASAVLAIVCVALVVGRFVQLTLERHRQPFLKGMRSCARDFATEVPEDGKVVVRGGVRFDWHGHDVAYHEPMAFTWMDRKGFVIAREDLTLESLESVVLRGGRYWWAKPEDLLDPELGTALELRFEKLASCGEFALYDLAPWMSGDGSEVRGEG